MKATVIGSINYDILVHQSRFTQIGETFVADRLWSGGGGKGANQAVQLAKLGVSTNLIGSVGADVFGEILLKEIASYGVQTDAIITSDCSSGMGVVTVIDSGKVMASIIEGANVSIPKSHIDKYSKIIFDSDVLLYQMEIPIDVMEHSFQYINKNTFVVLNAAPAKQLPDTFWKNIDCLVLNEVEATFYSKIDVDSVGNAKKAIEKIQKIIGSDIYIVITLGKNGSIVYNGREVEFIAPIDAPCIESTGAGDSFIGAFAYHYATQKNVFEAAKFGTKAATITIQSMGAQCSMPTLEQIL